MWKLLKKNILGNIKTLASKASLLVLLFIISQTLGSHSEELRLDTNLNPVNSVNSQNPSIPTLIGSVAESQYLPKELYGTWRVTTQLVSTNSPRAFKQMAVDIWILQQANNMVRLSNPYTRAESYITVNEVNNNTATFSCAKRYKNIYQVEQPTITVNGNVFKGKNIYQIIHLKGDNVIKTESGLFDISAVKLSGEIIDVFKKR